LSEAMSGPVPPPLDEEHPTLDVDPMEDGNALPSILRDFKPTKSKPDYLGRSSRAPTRAGSRGAGAGEQVTGTGAGGRGQGQGHGHGHWGRGVGARPGTLTATTSSGLLGSMAVSRGADFHQHEHLLKSRRFYLSAGAAGAPYAKDPLDDNADPTKANRRWALADIARQVIDTHFGPSFLQLNGIP